MMVCSLPGLATAALAMGAAAVFALPAFAQPAVISAIHQVGQSPPLAPAPPVPPPAAVSDLEPNHRADMRLVAGKRCEVRVWHPHAVLAGDRPAFPVRHQAKIDL
jgi:hypothetical protein